MHEPLAHAYVMNMIMGLQGVWTRAPPFAWDITGDHHFVVAPGARSQEKLYDESSRFPPLSPGASAARAQGMKRELEGRVMIVKMGCGPPTLFISGGGRGVQPPGPEREQENFFWQVDPSPPPGDECPRTPRDGEWSGTEERWTKCGRSFFFGRCVSSGLQPCLPRADREASGSTPPPLTDLFTFAPSRLVRTRRARRWRPGKNLSPDGILVQEYRERSVYSSPWNFAYDPENTRHPWWPGVGGERTNEGGKPGTHARLTDQTRHMRFFPGANQVRRKK
ncbi:hypothetical protein J2129_000676 [Methanofollis sp. W23]|nr:hypothetical protein [Methanofollis sp. W23]